MKLSILDLVAVRTGQTTSQALRAAGSVARWADAAGFTRYWLAEHHNMPSVASTNPPVLIGLIAAQTERIRVGSGGVMLPNHAPLVVAEQFALLEAAYPNRIDLGIGRAPGSDPVVTAVLNRSGATSDVNTFPRSIQEIQGLLERDGIEVSLSSGREYGLRSTPDAASSPDLWLLGSSDYSARLAAAQGLPYVFANHFGGTVPDQAMQVYRSEFRPGAEESPRTFMTVTAVAADTAQEAEERALSQMIMMARMRTNKPMTKGLTRDEAIAVELDPIEQSVVEGMRQNWIIGDADTVASRIQALADRFGVDEVMIAPATAEDSATDLESAPARIRTLELLADRLLDR
ncbi:luciferase family oxidoreductase group 1 [Mycetocola sp. BIGb0189]|uniref:LLM class flavin-dependent oxidoreductase n=1 Tax=Mycetocola sp. BIGb0189 TaxID=2940604 RepID=UPI0021691152|nr:LLM class flavin-dependent oxidoreductase [Mycetocola sp. BIGb0189]MCS4275019.1 luciferase family oxidoreductase group 1 [Mycetocola sp. BIGb0189]